MYSAYITRIKNLRKHSNADRLLCGECFGNTVIVSLETQENELGIYFPVDGKLGVEYATENNLLRRKDESGKNVGGYLDPEKRNIKALKLRGEKSDGLFMPLSSLENFTDISELREHDTITVLNGVVICEKYIPYRPPRNNDTNGNKKKTKKVSAPIAPLFLEHTDTAQLAYNLDAFRNGDQIEITLKMHGSSQRTANVPKFSRYKRTLWDRFKRREGEPIYDWGIVSGTRRTVLSNYEGGFYGSNAFREHHSKFFENALHKGEEVYYEVVGYTDNGVPIMPSCDNKKLNDKDFVTQYGDTTTFSYGCDPDGEDFCGLYECEATDSTDNITSIGLPKSAPYVYRMTMTNEDGDVVEYSPDFMRYRCTQIGARTVPVLWRGYIPDDVDAGEYVSNLAEQFNDGADPIGKTHVREGVVVRIVNRPKFTAYKSKNFSFKVLEGIIKDTADTPDMEEAEEFSDSNAVA